MLIIREALPKDLPQISDLCIAHAQYEGVKLVSYPEYEANLATLLFGTDPKVWCLVLAENDQLFGYASCTIQYATWTAKPYLYMDCIYLKEEVRGHGWGQKMMSQILTKAGEGGCEEIQWQTPENNKLAIDFYHKIGEKALKKFRFFWNR
ncbi:MAG: GNAT family N-acetyltransferase [Bacteroidota bacterium]